MSTYTAAQPLFPSVGEHWESPRGNRYECRSTWTEEWPNGLLRFARFSPLPGSGGVEHDWNTRFRLKGWQRLAVG
jgi:hypothetical protein